MRRDANAPWQITNKLEAGDGIPNSRPPHDNVESQDSVAMLQLLNGVPSSESYGPNSKRIEILMPRRCRQISLLLQTQRAAIAPDSQGTVLRDHDPHYPLIDLANSLLNRPPPENRLSLNSVSLRHSHRICPSHTDSSRTTFRISPVANTRRSIPGITAIARAANRLPLDLSRCCS